MKSYPKRFSLDPEAETTSGSTVRRGGTKRSWLLETSGNAITEFAVVVPLFVLMIFGLTDFTRLLFEQVTLQNAVRQGGRYASTGNHQPDPQHSGQNLSRVDSIKYVTQQAAMGLDTSNLQIASTKGGNGSAGGPLDTVTLTLTTSVRLMTPMVGRFFPNNTYTFTVTTSYRNEPFPPAQTS
jgi:Flp pilus assembly protein TadG